MTIKIDTTLPNDGNAPLYEKYDGQLQPQPAKLRMDEDGNVDVYVSGEIGGGVPMDQWHNRTLTWGLNAYLARDQVESMLADPEVIALLERIHEVHAVEWDGSNYVGSYDEDLYCKLQRLLDDDYNYNPEAQVLEASDWLFGARQTMDFIWPNDQPLDSVVKEMEEQAELDGVTLNGSVRDALIGYLQGEDPDELTGEHLRAYRKHAAD